MLRCLAPLLLAASLSAESVDELIAKGLAHHRSLKAIEQHLSAAEPLFDRSQRLDDPELSLSLSDIQFDDPLNRSIEPMQYTALTLKQRLPWFGKRHAEGVKVRAEEAQRFASLEAAKSALALHIRLRAYTVVELQRRLALIDDYLKLADQKISLSAAYTSTDNARHMAIMSAELVRSEFDVRRAKLVAALDAEKARLDYLVQAPYTTLICKEHIAPPPDAEHFLSQIEANRDYRIRRATLQRASAETKIATLADTPDPALSLGYYYRESHPDYVSVSVGATLPLYGGTSDGLEAARRDEMAAQSASEDYRIEVTAQIRAAYAQLRGAWHTYRILTDETLPQTAHMVDLGDAQLRSGSALFAYFGIVERRLDFEERRIIAEADYLRALARLKALTGAT